MKLICATLSLAAMCAVGLNAQSGTTTSKTKTTVDVKSGKTITVSARTSDGWSAYAKGDARVGFMEKLGFQLAPAIANIESSPRAWSESSCASMRGVAIRSGAA